MQCFEQPFFLCFLGNYFHLKRYWLIAMMGQSSFLVLDYEYGTIYYLKFELYSHRLYQIVLSCTC